MKGMNNNKKDGWEFDDDEDANMLKKGETFHGTQGYFQDPKQMSTQGTTELLACFTLCGTIKNCICFPCNLACRGSTVTIKPGYAGIMIKKGIYEKTLKPGFYYYNDCLYDIKQIDLRLQKVGLPSVNLITKDGLSIQIGGFLTYRITHPYLAFYAIRSIPAVLSGITGGVLKNVVAGNSFSALMKHKSEVAEMLKKILNESLSRGGVAIEMADITSINMPAEMKEAMSRAAIAKREAGAKRIVAQAEVQSSKYLKEAAEIMNQNKSSINLKYFETLKDIASGWNHTVILPDGMVYVAK